MSDKEQDKTPLMRFRAYAEAWKRRKYSDTFSHLSNNSFSRAELNYESGRARNIHYGDVLIKYGEILDINKDQIPYITDPVLVERMKASRLQEGDVVIADAAEDESVGKCTEVVNVGGEVVVSGLHTIPSRPNIDFASGYLGYYMNSISYHNQLLRLIQGTKVSSISKAALQDTVIYYPAKSEEQSKISKFLQTLDRLISLLQREMDLLKLQKQTLLSKMFAKQGELVPEIRFKRFTDDWEQRKLGECGDFEYGLNASAMDFDGIHKYIRITDIDEELRCFDERNLTSPDIDLSIPSSYLLKRGDILFARTGASVGKSYLHRDDESFVYFAGFLIRGRFSEEYNSEYIYQNTLTENYKTFIRIMSQRSGQPGINAQEYASYSLGMPLIEEQTAIGNFFRTLDDAITLHKLKLEITMELKKTLLKNMFI